MRSSTYSDPPDNILNLKQVNSEVRKDCAIIPRESGRRPNRSSRTEVSPAAISGKGQISSKELTVGDDYTVRC